MGYWLKRIRYLMNGNMLLGEIAAQMRHRNHRIYERELPEVGIESLAGPNGISPVSDSYEDGNISPFELECICRICRHHNPSVIFEIGTFNGRTSLNMASSSAPETRIFTLDLPREEIHKTRLRIKSGEKKFINKECSGERFLGTKWEYKIVQLFGDSAKFDFTPYHGMVDMVFIDGSHAYEYVNNDTLVALKLLRGGHGLILWHDYGWNEVNHALNEFYRQDLRFVNMKAIAGTNFAFLQR